MKNDFAIGLGLEMCVGRAHLAEGLVVVNLSVDREDQGLVIVGQGLGSRLYFNARATTEIVKGSVLEREPIRRETCADLHIDENSPEIEFPCS